MNFDFSTPGCNDVFNKNYGDRDADLSFLFHNVLKIEFHTLNCVETPISNIELKPVSSNCYNKKTIVY